MDTRPPPPAGAPPPYAFVGRIYKRSLRPIVLACCITGAVWSFLWGGSALQNIGSSNRFNKYDIVLGSLYLIVGMIEVYGTIAAAKQQLTLVRVYAYMSVLGALIVVAAESMRLGVHFSLKRALIDDCVSTASGATYYTWGDFWSSGSVPKQLTQAEAFNWCDSRWSRGVWRTIAWLVIASLLGWFFCSVAFSYYHQLLSPQTAPPSQQFRLGQLRAQPGYDQGPYQPYNPQGGYQYPRGPTEDFVPPYDPHKVPGYYQAGGGKDVHGDDKEPHTPITPYTPHTGRVVHGPDDDERPRHV